MGERPDGSAGGTGSVNDGLVVVRIRDDETAFAHQRRDGSLVGEVAHAEAQRSRLVHELRNLLLQLSVQRGLACNIREHERGHSECRAVRNQAHRHAPPSITLTLRADENVSMTGTTWDLQVVCQSSANPR